MLGCASTALAAANYDDFYTAHSLFKIPVLENEAEQLDLEDDFQCQIYKYKQKIALLNAATVTKFHRSTYGISKLFTMRRKLYNSKTKLLF